MTEIRVLVLDDHPLLRNGVAAVLSAQAGIRVAGEAADGQSALGILERTAVDLCLVDLRMPGMDGVQFMREASLRCPGLRFVVLTTYDGIDEVHAALQAGASGYLLKGMAAEELVDAVRVVSRGGRFLPPRIEEKYRDRIDAGLTRREMEILRLIARGLSNRDIGVELSITEGTVKWNVNHILSKLDAQDRTQAVTLALRRGLIQLENP